MNAMPAVLALVLLALPAGAAELVGPQAPPIIGQERAIAWATEQREDYSRWARREANLLCAASAADLGLTEAVLARGGAESNPLVRNRPLRLSLSLGACVAAQIGSRGAHPHPRSLRTAKWVRVGAALINVIVLTR
jgi:hypothetical protein